MECRALIKLGLVLVADTTGVHLAPGLAIPRIIMLLRPDRRVSHAPGLAVQLFLARRA